MKKTNKTIEEPVVIDEEILRKAKLALQSDRPITASKCVICGARPRRRPQRIYAGFAAV